MEDRVVTQQNRFRLDDPEGQGDQGHQDRVVNQESGENQGEIGSQFRQRRVKVQSLDGTGQNHRRDGPVGERADFQMGGADQKRRGCRLEQDKVEFPGADQFGKFGQAGHEKSGEDLDDQLIRGDQHNHFIPAPAGHFVHVVVDHPDKGELENKPGQLHRHPDKETRAEHQFPGGGVADLQQPKTEELHFSLAAGGGVTPEAGFPDEMGENKKEKCPAVLETEAGFPRSFGERSAKSRRWEPVFVGKGKEAYHGEERGGQQIERKDMAAGEKLKGVDQKDQGADIEQPERAQGKAKGEAKLEKSSAEQGRNPVDEIEVGQFKVHCPGKYEKAEGDGDQGGDEVGAASCRKQGSPIETVRKGAQENWIEHALADFP